jgi:hypothetical protein
MRGRGVLWKEWLFDNHNGGVCRFVFDFGFACLLYHYH